LPTTEEPGPEPPTWLVFHEFETDEVDGEVLSGVEADAARENKFSVTILPVYKIVKTHGEGDWFHGK
jgi:hypothetical protein